MGSDRCDCCLQDACLLLSTYLSVKSLSVSLPLISLLHFSIFDFFFTLVLLPSPTCLVGFACYATIDALRSRFFCIATRGSDPVLDAL